MVKPIVIGYTSQHALSYIIILLVVLINDMTHFARPDLNISHGSASCLDTTFERMRYETSNQCFYAAFIIEILDLKKHWWQQYSKLLCPDG